MNWFRRPFERAVRSLKGGVPSTLIKAPQHGSPGGESGSESGESAGAENPEVARLAAQLRSAEDLLRRADQYRRQTDREIDSLRKERDQEATERRRLAEEVATASQSRLWAWAEEEVRRLQDSLKKARERHYRAEEELETARTDREIVERRARTAEEEAARLRDQARQNERTSASARPTTPVATKVEAAQPPPLPPVVPKAPQHLPRVVAPVRPPKEPRIFLPTKDLRDAKNGDAPIDMNAALSGVDGDTDLLRAIARAFEGEEPYLLSDLRLAIDDADWESAERTLGNFRGALSSLGATVARQALERLRTSVEAQDTPEAEESFIALQLELERLKPVLTTLPTN